MLCRVNERRFRFVFSCGHIIIISELIWCFKHIFGVASLVLAQTRGCSCASAVILKDMGARYLTTTKITKRLSWTHFSGCTVTNTWTYHKNEARWRHQMEILSTLLVLCAGNSPVTGEFPAQRPVTRSFDVFFDLRLNKRMSKQSWGWWFETPSYSLWRHRNGHYVNESDPTIWFRFLTTLQFGRDALTVCSLCMTAWEFSCTYILTSTLWHEHTKHGVYIRNRF